MLWMRPWKSSSFLHPSPQLCITTTAVSPSCFKQAFQGFTSHHSINPSGCLLIPSAGHDYHCTASSLTPPVVVVGSWRLLRRSSHVSSPLAMLFGSVGLALARADTPHCISFSNKACFHGDHLSTSAATFYGSRAHNASAVSYPIFKNPSPVWTLSFCTHTQPVEAASLHGDSLHASISWTISSLIKNIFASTEDRAKDLLTEMRSDCSDVHLPVLQGFSITPLSFFCYFFPSASFSFSLFPPPTIFLKSCVP